MYWRSWTAALLGGLVIACSAGPTATPPEDDAIARVEHGLVRAVVIKGRTAERMAIADRMAHYRVPGVSVAVMRGGEIAWGKGYGVLEAGGTEPVTVETRFFSRESGVPNMEFMKDDAGKVVVVVRAMGQEGKKVR